MKRIKLVSFFTILIGVLIVFLINMSITGCFSTNELLIIRLGLIFAFISLWKIFSAKGKREIGNLAFILMTVNLSFLIVSFFTVNFWNLNIESTKGVSLAKLSDSFVISIVLISVLLIGGFRLKDFYLKKGKLIKGLLIGIISFIILGYLAINNPENPIEMNFLKREIGWILLFVFSNAFMEELLFRGIFLKQLNNFIHPYLSILLMSIVFSVSHIQVSYTSDLIFFITILLILGFVWGYLIHYTKSLWASILFHAGADLLIIIPIFSTFGAIK
jgi:membrane protease YdiL (CAAX protease family)